MRSFPGFREGLSRQTSLPESFFGELLPLIDDLAELQVILFCCRSLAQKDAPLRYLQRSELETDEHLLLALRQAAPGQVPADTLQRALERATRRRVLLAATFGEGEDGQTLFVLNSAGGRDLLARLEAGQWRPGDARQTAANLPGRPGLFRLYEANIGTITPMLAEQLKEAEAGFPYFWLEEALQLAVQHNKRNWRYVRAILDRWEREGRDRGLVGRDERKDWRRFVRGRYARFIDS
ncbi:MAG: DnaD domain protein [Anaerolineaceae bacterium]|nr:DnaD domain protein [Anaerolineaceae bacterium]MCY3907007.1 DnaD domain protein [Anaerolineaceae bacterium]